MRLTYERLDCIAQFNADYDAHAVHALVDENHKPIIATFVHREGRIGMSGKNGAVIKSLGGTRFWKYDNDQAAIKDGLRLGSAMSKKAASLGYDIGGAKTVIFAHNMREDDLPEVLNAFGQKLLPKIGTYMTAEDVNIKLLHMVYLRERAPKGVVGGYSHDVSATTARGVVIGIKAALDVVFGSIFAMGDYGYAVRGVGSVGKHIVNMLYDLGSRRIIIADPTDGRAKEVAAKRDGIYIVSSDEIYDAHADVFVPCALGGSINESIIDRMSTYVVAGCENNQLATSKDGLMLHNAGHVYAPDYIINAGGLVDVVSTSITGQPIDDQLFTIGETLKQILTESKRTNTPPSMIADNMVKERVAQFSIPE